MNPNCDPQRILSAHSAGLMRPGEVWLGHPRFPAYLIGVHGAVLSLVKRKPRILSPTRMGTYAGFQMVGTDGRLAHMYLHRLVAEVVHGPCPEGKECAHRDGDKANADFTNLRWATHTENEADKLHTGTRPRGERAGQAKLTNEAVRKMRAMRAAEGVPYHELARRFGVTTMTAHRAVTGKCWGDVQ